jgi:uroporphyrinogen decarboxylase
MDAIDRVLKSINHEEPDRVPSFEISIDNLKICNHFNEDYLFKGTTKATKDIWELNKGDIEEVTQTFLKASETRSYLKNVFNRHLSILNKNNIDLATVPLTGYIMFPNRIYYDYFTDEYGRNFELKNTEDTMDIFYYRDGIYKNFEEYEAGIKPDPDNPRRKKYFTGMKKVQDSYEGKIYCAPALWSTFEATWQAFGFPNFCRQLIHSPNIKKIFDERGKFQVEVLKRFIEWGESNLVFVFDDFGYKTGLMISPSHYKKYVIPWMNEICKVAHKAGLKVILHSCGDIYKIFEDLINAGVDVFHPIEPTTANPDYDIFKLKEKYGDKITLMGNVSPQDLATQTPEFIQNYTKKLIKELAPGGGYILSSGHSINPAVKLENFFAMHDTLKKYGNYPIQIN